MKTKGLAIITENISGFQIVTGATELSREPQATNSVNQKAVMDLPIATELIEAIQKKAKHVTNSQKAFNDEKNQIAFLKIKEKELQEKQALKLNLTGHELSDCECGIADCENKIKYHTGKAEAHNKIYHDEQGAANSADNALKEVGARFKTAKEDHFRENPVFCEPGKGQLIDGDLKICVADDDGLPVVKTAATVDAERAALDENYVSMVIPEGMTAERLAEVFFNKSKNEQITIESDSVVDFRGYQYYFKAADGIWYEEPVITELGYSKNSVVNDTYEDSAIEKKDLSQEQAEEWRLQNLTPDQKISEFESHKSGLAQRAQAMETELKFSGNTEYVFMAQEFYNTELELLKIKYGVL